MATADESAQHGRRAGHSNVGDSQLDQLESALARVAVDVLTGPVIPLVLETRPDPPMRRSVRLKAASTRVRAAGLYTIGARACGLLAALPPIGSAGTRRATITPVSRRGRNLARTRCLPPRSAALDPLHACLAGRTRRRQAPGPRRGLRPPTATRGVIVARSYRPNRSAHMPASRPHARAPMVTAAALTRVLAAFKRTERLIADLAVSPAQGNHRSRQHVEPPREPVPIRAGRVGYRTLLCPARRPC